MFYVASRQACGACSKLCGSKLNSVTWGRWSFFLSSCSSRPFSIERRCNRVVTMTIFPSDLLRMPAVMSIKCQGYASRTMNKEPKSKKGGKPKVHLSDEDLSQIINIQGFRTQLEFIVQRLQDDFVKQLSLRTSAGALESLIVEVDGEKYPLNEVGQVTRKNPHLIVINLSTLPDALRCVMDAIEKSGMNLNPQQEGTNIFVPIPQITREHRENLAKNAKSLFNQTKDDLREAQNRTIKSIRGKKGNFSDDLIFDSQLQVASITESYVVQAETMLQKKQVELLGEKQ